MGNVGYLLPVKSGISNEQRVTMQDTTSLVATLAMPILFAATSIRFGVDTREVFARQRDRTSSDSNSRV